MVANHCLGIRVLEHFKCDGRCDPGQPHAVINQLYHGDVLFAILGKLRPVQRHLLVNINVAVGFLHQNGKDRNSLGGKEHGHHRILFPCMGAPSLGPCSRPKNPLTLSFVI